MTPDTSRANDYRLLILAPTRRDAAVTSSVLERAAITCTVCDGPASLAQEISAGAGAILLTDAFTSHAQAGEVIGVLARQEPWSDIPVILLSRAEAQGAMPAKLWAALTNVTILDRPTSTRTLVSAVQAAIRGRARQYQIREQLDALRTADETLRSADRRKDEFLAMLAHELRNPLAPIRTASELLSRTLPTDARTQTTINIVKRQVTHLTRLVDDLMDVSRITQGRIQLQLRALELGSIVTQAMESVDPLMRDKHHKIIVSSGFGPLYVDGDSARLVQCVANLLTNAAKYTDPSGEIRVELSSEQGAAVVAVSDNGVGIAKELLPRIFELFVQSARSLDRSEGGLGIGLSVVQRLVEMHGGTVSAASAGPGCGSTFTIRLPSIAPPHETLKAPARTRTDPRRILIVDDNEDAATSLAEFLQLDGHEAEAVFSASSALLAVATFKPDIVLLDIGLPEMDGYEVAGKIRAGGSSVRLVALTGYGQAEDIERTRAAGFDGHLVKPVDFGALEKIVAASNSPSALHAPSR